MCFSCSSRRYGCEGANNMWKMRASICVIFDYQKVYQRIHARQSRKQKKNKLEELEKQQQQVT